MDKKNKIPSVARGFATLPELTKLHTVQIEKIKTTLYGDEDEGDVGICKKVAQMYKSWLVSTVILKYVFPIISAVIIVLLTIIINKLFGG